MYTKKHIYMLFQFIFLALSTHIPIANLHLLTYPMLMELMCFLSRIAITHTSKASFSYSHQPQFHSRQYRTLDHTLGYFPIISPTQVSLSTIPYPRSHLGLLSHTVGLTNSRFTSDNATPLGHTPSTNNFSTCPFPSYPSPLFT